MPKSHDKWQKILRQYYEDKEHFADAVIETKAQALRRDSINEKVAELDIDDWSKLGLPSIPYHSVIHTASVQALQWLQKPHLKLESQLNLLANGGALEARALCDFVEEYAKFKSCAELLYARDTDVDELEAQRKARSKTNKDRWVQHAAISINSILKSDPRIGIEQARNSFAKDVDNAIESGAVPAGWTVAEYKGFLGKPYMKQPQLKNKYGRDLTETKIMAVVQNLLKLA